MPKATKRSIKHALLNALEYELNDAISAADEAHSAAIDDQSVAETQYDTLAIEASYLAEGHSRRVNELKTAITQLNQLDIERQLDSVALGALVQLGSTPDIWYFISPAAAGTRLTINEKTVQVITLQSPLGQSLVGKTIDDDVLLIRGKQKLEDEIIGLY